MKLHHHTFAGCTPTPLANYLKALGIFRIVAEQFDPECRGWWENEQFQLLSTLSRDELEQAFLEKYEPTPLVSPWNKGCGFFKRNDPGLHPLEVSTAPRFRKFRDGVFAARVLLQDISTADATIRAIKASTKRDSSFQNDTQRLLLSESPIPSEAISKIETEMKTMELDEESNAKYMNELKVISRVLTSTRKPESSQEAKHLKEEPGYKRLLAIAERRFKSLKEKLIFNCRRSWRGPHAEWLASAVVLDDVGNTIWPSLLGTGGNDGNLDFTNNWMQRLGEIFQISSITGCPNDSAARLLRWSFWRTPTCDLSTGAIGQFQPGSSGGVNSSTGADGPSVVDPWDFILMMEGAIVISSRATRRLSPNDLICASAPFSIRAHAAAYASAGGEKAQRGEQWMPIWNRPSNYMDVSALFGEARVQLGRQAASTPLNAARAIFRLGIARGVSQFNRFGYLERNGQSTFAVALGRIRVHTNRFEYLISDLESWLEKLQRQARDNLSPACLRIAERSLMGSIFEALTRGDYAQPSTSRWQSILHSSLEIEKIQRAGTAIDAGPIPLLRPEWLVAINDNSVELRLAVAMASAASEFDRQGYPVDSIRHHWLPIVPGRFPKFNKSERALAKDPRVVITGRDVLGDCAAVVERRIIEAEKLGKRSLPLVPHRNCGASLEDIQQFIIGAVDDRKLFGLARALMALKWNQVRKEHIGNLEKPTQSGTGLLPDDSWLMLRLVHLPRALNDGRLIPVESSVTRLLQSGQSTRAIEISTRRLQSVGIKPPVSFGYVNQTTARRWAAALVFPLSQGSFQRAAETIDPRMKVHTHV
jgi:CRISPR-associated protein Csx17